MVRTLSTLGAAVLCAAGALRAQTPPRSHLLVLNKDDAAMAAVDESSGNVLWIVKVGDGPHELVASDDGRYAFASNYGTGPAPGHTISMIDLAARTELRRIDVAPLSRPHGLAVAGGKLYFTAEGSKKIARYDPSADRVDWTFETGQETTHMVLVSRDLRRLFTSNIGSSSISIVDAGAGGAWTQTVVPVGQGPEGIDFSPDGRQVWTAHSRDGGVSVIDVASKKVVDTLPVGTKHSNRLRFAPDGSFIAISDTEAGELVVLDGRTHQVRTRVAVGKSPEGVLVAPDGSRVFVAVNGDNVVAAVDPRTWRVASRIQAGRGPDGMAWVK
jgi:YVTN family beta-propeller protein